MALTGPWLGCFSNFAGIGIAVIPVVIDPGPCAAGSDVGDCSGRHPKFAAESSVALGRTKDVPDLGEIQLGVVVQRTALVMSWNGHLAPREGIEPPT